MERKITDLIPHSYFTSPVVSVIFGDSGKTYYVHKALLTTFSRYFDGYLNPGFVEGRTLTTTLKAENETLFRVFVNWLYTRRLSLDASWVANDICCSYIASYGFGDRLIALDFKNALIDRLRQDFRDRERALAAVHITMIRELGLLKSKLGRFLVERFAWQVRFSPTVVLVDEIIRDHYHGFLSALQTLYTNPEAAGAVLKEVVEHTSKDCEDPQSQTGCVYHEHENGRKCNGK